MGENQLITDQELGGQPTDYRAVAGVKPTDYIAVAGGGEPTDYRAEAWGKTQGIQGSVGKKGQEGEG